MYHRKNYRKVLSALALLVLFGSAQQVSAEVFVATNNMDFGTFDIATGTFSKLGTTGDVIITAMTFAPNGTLYAEGVDNTYSNNRLYTVNPTNGSTTPVSPVQVNPGIIVGLVAASNSTLLGYDYLNPAPFYSIPANGAAITFLGNSNQTLDFFGSDSLEYGLGGTLYADADTQATGINQTALFTVNPSNGEWTMVGTSLVTGEVLALIFDGSTMYGVDASGLTNNIYRIDTTLGTATLMGNVKGMAEGDVFNAAAARVPEPGTLALLLAPILGLFLNRWRRVRKFAIGGRDF